MITKTELVYFQFYVEYGKTGIHVRDIPKVIIIIIRLVVIFDVLCISFIFGFLAAENGVGFIDDYDYCAEYMFLDLKIDKM